jgi:hypothetical protein
MNVVSILIIALAVLIALDIAALRYGVDSRDDFDSPEWERRRQWRSTSGG